MRILQVFVEMNLVTDLVDLTSVHADGIPIRTVVGTYFFKEQRRPFRYMMHQRFPVTLHVAFSLFKRQTSDVMQTFLIVLEIKRNKCIEKCKVLLVRIDYFFIELID